MTTREVMEQINTYALPILAAVLGWFGSKLKTRREKKAEDIQVIQDAIAPLLKSISELTAHNNAVTQQLIAEQKKTLELLQEKAAWSAERDSLVNKVDSLQKQVTKLTTMVKKLTKESNEESDSSTTNT